MASKAPVTSTSQGWLVDRLRRLGREATVCLLAGLIAGALVGGIGGRLAMRVSAAAGGDEIAGRITEAEATVGDITNITSVAHPKRFVLLKICL